MRPKTYIAKSSILLVIGIVLLVIITPMVHADITASANLDNSVIRAGETTRLTLTITATGGENIAIPTAPQVNGLQINFLTKQESQQIQFDGRQMQSTRTLSLTYEVIATKEGKYEITFNLPGVNNQDQTNPVTLTVLESDAPTPTKKPGLDTSQSNPYGIFVLAEVTKEKAYVGEEIHLTYTAFLPSRRNARPVQIEDRRGQFQGFWTETFDYGNQRSLERVRLSNGQIYDKVNLIKYILFPLKPGEQVISPLTLICQVPERSDNFGFPFGQRKRVKVQSKPVIIQAIPLPKEGKPEIFQGAVGNFSLQSSIDNKKLNVGDTVTLKVLLEGRGNIRNAPKPVLPDLSKFNQFAPTKDENIQVTKDGVSGRIEYTYVLVPHDVNANKIAPVRFAYFDPAKEKYFTLTTQSHELSIQSTAGMGPKAFLSDRRIITRVGEDFRFISTTPAALSVIRLPIYKNASFWFFVIFPLVLLALGLYIKSYREYVEKNPEFVKSRSAPRMAKKLLANAQQAYQHQEYEKVYAHLEKALHDYISNRWNFSSVGMTTDELRHRLEQQNIDKETIASVLEQLEQINTARYSGMAGNPENARHNISTTEQVLTRLMKQKGTA